MNPLVPLAITRLIVMIGTSNASVAEVEVEIALTGLEWERTFPEVTASIPSNL